MNKPTAMEIKAARAACKRHAEICNVDEQDLWKMHGEEFIEDAKLSLDAAGAPDLLEALKEIIALDQTEENEWDAVERVIPTMVQIAQAATAKATENQHD
jgi:hypothetical protein